MTELTSIDASVANLPRPRQARRGRPLGTQQPTGEIPISRAVPSRPVGRNPAAARTSTRLGRFIEERMDALGMRRQVDLVAAITATGGQVSDTTVSRLINHEGSLPDRNTLLSLAVALQVDPKDLVLFAFDLDDEPAAPPAPHPLASELDRMLDPKSPLPKKDRERLADFVGQIMEPFRPAMRRRRSA
jgi:hypothetical protein